MNAITHAEGTALPVAMGFNDLASFEFLQRTAKLFSVSSMVPASYQATITKGYGRNATIEDNPAALSNCVIALDMSQRMNANPLMIMQNLHIIEGRPSWSSQFIIAAINNCGKFSPLRFDLEWLGEIDANYSTFEWVDGRKVEKKNNVRIKNARCVAWATEKATGERLESAPVTMEMAVNEGWYGKNGSKWKSMPDLMMRYRSAAFFGRIYAPELLMGLPAEEEVHDVFTVAADGQVHEERGRSVPQSTGTIDPDTGEITPEVPAYPQADFEKNVGKWAKLIASRKQTQADVIAMVSTKGSLSEEQEKALTKAVEDLLKANAPSGNTQAQDVEAKPTPQAAQKAAPAAKPAAQPTQEVPPEEGQPFMTFAQVNTKLSAAQDRDSLDAAADLIQNVDDEQHRDELNAIYDDRLRDLTQ